jgi:hypothetical protein
MLAASFRSVNSLLGKGDVMATTKHEELHGLKKTLYQRVERLRGELQEAEAELQAVTKTLQLLTKGRGREEREIESKVEAFIHELHGLTQVEALVKLAKANGNRLKTKDAKRILVAAGLIKSRKNAANILFTTIQRSERFKRIVPGEYELMTKPVTASLTSQYEVFPKKVSA